VQILSTHRQITLRALSAALGDLATVRARPYEAYRRRLGQDSADLPERFVTLVDEVATFADPLIAPTSGAHYWRARNRTGISRPDDRRSVRPPDPVSATDVGRPGDQR
jgi:hypothetical protein